jgi:DNA-directed RNA polymerase subunit RPC12/RpoP
MTSKKMKRNVTADDGQAKSKNQSYCGLGLCRKTTNLTETECCNNWICDDEDQYVSFSYARNSCFRNHRRYTLCGYHHAEGHSGHWKECSQCREDTETEMYVYYGTNEYNFEKLENPPDYEPTKCSKCGVVIKLGAEGFTQSGDEYWCEACGARELEKMMRRTKASSRSPKGRG